MIMVIVIEIKILLLVKVCRWNFFWVRFWVVFFFLLFGIWKKIIRKKKFVFLKFMYGYVWRIKWKRNIREDICKSLYWKFLVFVIIFYWLKEFWNKIVCCKLMNIEWFYFVFERLCRIERKFGYYFFFY